MYWSVSFSVPGDRSGDLFSPMRSGKFRGLRYTTKHDLDFHGMIESGYALVKRRPSMKVLYHSGALMLRRSKNISRMISCTSVSTRAPRENIDVPLCQGKVSAVC